MMQRVARNYYFFFYEQNLVTSGKNWAWIRFLVVNPPGSESMPIFFRMSPSFARRKKVKVSNNSSSHFLQPTVLRILKNRLFWP